MSSRCRGKLSCVRVAIANVWFVSGRFRPAVRLEAALDSRDQEDLSIRIELTNQYIALLRDVRWEPPLGDFFVKFLFDFGETLGIDSFRIPFCKGLVSAGTNHSKLL